jgi:parallel beta-helix repeat protein
MAQPLTFDFYNSIIEVPLPDTNLDIQYLINQIRDEEDELVPSLSYNTIADAAGKFDLGGGVLTAITVKLLDNWRVRFAERPSPNTVQCTISGGNLVGGPGGNPIAPSPFTQVVLLSSASGTIATPTTSNENTNIKYLLSSLAPNKRALGNIFYWDPISGSDANSGLTPSSAVKTFVAAHSLVTTGANDIIFAVSSDPSGITTTTENLTITKNNVKLRGPGYVFQIIPSETTNDTILISGDNVEISGLYLETAATGSQNGITVSGNSSLIEDCWIGRSQGKGISLSNSKLNIVTSCVIEHCANNGINLGDSSVQTTISKCIIFDNQNGVTLSGSNISDNILENNLIYKNSAYGVDIEAGVSRTTLRSGNTYHNNLSGSYLNVGTNSYIETQAGGESATTIASAVWDEVLSSHITSQTAGKILRDTKVKATLASLK